MRRRTRVVLGKRRRDLADGADESGHDPYLVA